MNTEILENPTVKKYYPGEDKVVLSMEWSNEEGLLHREDGKPALIEFWKDDTVREERFYKNGKNWRADDLPTTVFYRENGMVEQEIWEDEFGNYDRSNDLPAIISYDFDGNVLSMEWHKKGRLSRDGKPAVIYFWESGSVRMESFLKDDANWRAGGLPTTVFYYEDGTVEQEVWEDILGLYNRGNDLPSVISYDLDGNVTRKDWYIEDVPSRKDGKPEAEIYKNGKLVETIKGDISTISIF